MVSLSIIPNNDMKIRKLLLVLLPAVMTLAASAQNKVGDNPQTIHGGSLLELESATKGLRLPRIVLNDATKWTLAGDNEARANGMLIFNETGTEPRGLYYWSEKFTRWVRVVNVNELPDLIANSVNQSTAVRDSVVKSINVAIKTGTLTVPNLVQPGAITDNVVLADPATGALKIMDFSTLQKSGTTVSNNIAGGQLITTVNEKASTPVAIPNMFSSTDNLLSSTVAGGAPRTAKIINSNTLSASTGSLVSTVNGQSSAAVPVANGLTASAAGGIRLGGSLADVTTISTDAEHTLTIAGLINGSSNDNLLLAEASTGVMRQGKLADILQVTNMIDQGKITTTVNGASGTASIGNILSMSGNRLTSTVAGEAKSADIITTNALSGNGGKLTSTINGVPSSTGVLVNSGLNISATAIQLGGELLIPNTTITTTANNTLSIKGLVGDGAISDKVVVANGTDGLLKTIDATNNNTFGTIVARDANGDFSASKITANDLIAGYQTAEVFNTTATILNIGGAATTLNMGTAAGITTLKGSFAQSGAGTFTTGTGAVTLNGATTLNSNFIQSGAGAFTTGTGAVTLNGATTINNDFTQTGNKTFTTGSGAVALNGHVTLDKGKILKLSGSSAGTVGLIAPDIANTYSLILPTMQAAAGQVLTSSDGNGTLIWTSVAPVEVGGVEGNTLRWDDSSKKWATSDAFTNDGTVLTANKDFIQTATGTFTTGTGAVTLNGAVSIAANKSLTFATGAGNFDQSASSGVFKTGTGAVALNGAVTVAADNSFTQTGTGTFTTGSGVVTLNGDVTVTTGKVTTPVTTAEVFNTTAETLNIGGAATTLKMGAATGTTTVNNDLLVMGKTTLKTLAAAADADNVVTVAADGTLHQRVLGVTPFIKVTGDYTIKMADNTVVLKGATANVAFTLPTIADGVVVGTTFRIINLSNNFKISLSAAVRTAFDLQISQILSGSTTVDGTVAGNKMTIMWDGDEWIQAGN
jgi:hypothetical protein